jgi:RimK family alpha-L-glutamate ligase
MQVAILSARAGWHTDQLCRALTGRGHAARVLPYEGLVARFGAVDREIRLQADDPPASGPAVAGRSRADPLSDLSSANVALLEADAVLARIIPQGSLEQIIYRVDALHWIETRGVAVINSPRAIERSVDKFYTHALLDQAGLPTPETLVCETIADAVAAVRALGDVIVKPIFGSMGIGMVRITDPDVAVRILRALEQMRAVFYVQRAIDHGGRDVRAFVIGGRVVGAIQRQAPPGEWRTNVSHGGTATPFDLPPTWERLALRAAAAVGADYAGVDLLPSRDGGVFVLEVNAIPGWQGLQQATGIDVAAAIVGHLEHRVGAGTSAAELSA